MEKGSLTEMWALARRQASKQGCSGSYGIAPETAASSGRQSLRWSEPVSIGWRKPA
jgi:hypothetical protein